jgi:hypothetical protein
MKLFRWGIKNPPEGSVCRRLFPAFLFLFLCISVNQPELDDFLPGANPRIVISRLVQLVRGPNRIPSQDFSLGLPYRSFVFLLAAKESLYWGERGQFRSPRLLLKSAPVRSPPNFVFL